MTSRALLNPRTNGQAVLLVLVGAASIQFGAAFAAKLFPRVGPEGAVTLRLVIAAVVMLAVIRPKVRGRSRAELATVVGLGVALGGMNLCFYQAIARLPLGPAVTLEFLGPLGLAVVLSRRLRDLFWIVLAAVGVLMLGEGGFSGLDGVGVAFVFAAAAFWAAYIMIATRTARTFKGVDGLALAMAVAAVLVLPFGVVGAGTSLVEPGTLGFGLVVALMSSVVPYSCEMLALKRLSAGTFGLLASLEPAVAALAGLVVLSQTLGLVQVAGIMLVVAASAGVTISQTSEAAGPASASGGEASARDPEAPAEGRGAGAEDAVVERVTAESEVVEKVVVEMVVVDQATVEPATVEPATVEELTGGLPPQP